jgi:hypothetical protein
LGKNIGGFLLKLLLFLQKFDNNIVFLEKRQFFSPKIGINRRKL